MSKRDLPAHLLCVLFLGGGGGNGGADCGNIKPPKSQRSTSLGISTATTHKERGVNFKYLG
jgi:hypothetical protein